MPANYVKIDGALMQGLATDRSLQERVKVLVQRARAHGIATIAERVEDANTMAVLWQLGIEFIQGYFVSNPEEVVLGVGREGHVLATRAQPPLRPFRPPFQPSTLRQPRGSTPPRWPRSPR